MNAGSVMGDTYHDGVRTYTKEFVLTFPTHRWWDAKTLDTIARVQEPPFSNIYNI